MRWLVYKHDTMNICYYHTIPVLFWGKTFVMRLPSIFCTQLELVLSHAEKCPWKKTHTKTFRCKSLETFEKKYLFYLKNECQIYSAPFLEGKRRNLNLSFAFGTEPTGFWLLNHTYERVQADPSSSAKSFCSSRLPKRNRTDRLSGKDKNMKIFAEMKQLFSITDRYLFLLALLSIALTQIYS